MSQETITPETNTSSTTEAPKPKAKRGFAAMSAEQRSDISRRGGKAAHAAGRAHQFTSAEAREAGRKGGKASHAKQQPQSQPSQQDASKEIDLAE